MSIEPIKGKGTLSDQAYRIIKDGILSLKLEPGSLLLEEDLSKMLGISRTPIRTALQKLSHEDLVLLGNKGTYVTELSHEAFFDIYAIRESLELLSIREAAQHRTEEDIKEMELLLEEQDQLMYQPTLAARTFLSVDRKLHQRIAKSGNNNLLIKYLHQINESFNRYLYYTEFEYRATNVVSEHKELVEAIKKRDSYTAQNIMQKHLMGVKESIILALLKKQAKDPLQKDL